MRVIELSRHPGDELRRTTERRELERRRAPERPDRYRQPSLTATMASRASPDGPALMAWFRDTLATRRATALGKIDDLRAVAPPDIVALREAKAQGERHTAAELARSIGSEWVMLRGYHNEAGQIDQLLLGSRGLVAIGSMWLNATVHCDGDSWRADRFDNYEQFLGRMSIDDNLGRSPSEQLNEPADTLTDVLRMHGHDIGVARVILLTYPLSRLGKCRKPEVTIFTSVSDLTSWLHRLPRALDAATCTAIEKLIVTDQRSRSANELG